MAIRLRLNEDGWRALCAAESMPLLDDIYLDDAQDHALRLKFLRDYQSEGLTRLETVMIADKLEGEPECNCDAEERPWRFCELHENQ